MSSGIGPGTNQQLAAAALMAKLGINKTGNTAGGSVANAAAGAADSLYGSGGVGAPLSNDFTNWGTGAMGGAKGVEPPLANSFQNWGTGGYGSGAVADPNASDPNSIYQQLMQIASQGSAGGYSYDLKGALKGIADSYNPALQNLTKLAGHKTAREKANETSLNQVYAQLDQRLGATGKESKGNYAKTIGTNDKTYASETASANQAAQDRIAQMTADYTRLGQQDRIAGDTQKILSQRDQALERINAQGQALHGSTQQLQNANADWFQQGQGISRFEGTNAVRDQKAQLQNALDALDSQRAGILGNQAQAQASARNSYQASYHAPSGPNISQILAILSAQDSHGKALDAHAAASSTNAGDSALNALIQKGGLNGADAYAQAQHLPTNYSTALRDFITNGNPTKDTTGMATPVETQLQKALQYAAANNLDPAAFENMFSKYLKL